MNVEPRQNNIDRAKAKNSKAGVSRQLSDLRGEAWGMVRHTTSVVQHGPD
jgi:hypothetical protein